MVTPLVTSLLHFHQYKLFKNMVCVLVLFGLFWVLFKKLGDFFPNHLVTLVSLLTYWALFGNYKENEVFESSLWSDSDRIFL